MRIIFLGTATGIPQRNNYPSSIYVESNESKIVFDFGEGLIKSLVERNIDINDIDAVFLTHFHVDHVAGIVPLLFAFRYEGNPRKKTFYIIGPKGTVNFLKKLFRIFKGQIEPKGYELIIKELGTYKFINFKGIKIKTFKTNHKKESIGYIIYLGKKRICYTGDTGYDRNYKKILRKVDILITECSLPIDVKNHLNPQKLLRLIEDIKPSETYLVHIYPVMRKNMIIKYLKNKKIFIPKKYYEISI
ncbi:MAG: ribonuclease Z [Candidatus Hydrothermales bacterium]